jgi:hypothetical protein
MFTVPPGGTNGGALYTVAWPLLVWVREKAPQAPLSPQVTVQFTPELLESLVTVAVMPAVSFTPSEVGGVWLKVIAGEEELEEHETNPPAIKAKIGTISARDSRIPVKTSSLSGFLWGAAWDY